MQSITTVTSGTTTMGMRLWSYFMSLFKICVIFNCGLGKGAEVLAAKNRKDDQD